MCGSLASACHREEGSDTDSAQGEVVSVVERSVVEAMVLVLAR
jgi:hypothetical protein